MLALRLRVLEDRIVFDGALAHSVVVATPPPAAEAPHAPVNVAFVPDNLPDAAILKDAISGHTIVLSYNPNTETLETLSARLSAALNGAKASTIAFLTDGHNGSFNLLSKTAVNAATIESQAMQDFFHRIANDLLPDGSLNILGCSVAKDEVGINFLKSLENILESNGNDYTVNASTDITGNPTSGGNWLLEYSTDSSATGFDAGGLYLVNGIAAGWEHTLDPAIIATPNGGLYTYEAGGSTTFNITLNTVPTSDVTFSIVSLDTTEGVTAQSSVIFHPGDSTDTYTITVSGVDDVLADGNINYQVQISYQSGDSAFVGVSTLVNLTNVDNETHIAPVLDPSASDHLSPVSEDYYSNPGNSIAELLASDPLVPNPITDVNGHPQGLAIYALDTANGHWEYYLGSSNSWVVASSVTFNNALLLGASDTLRFVPNANYYGDATITYVAWDGTTGTAGGRVNLGTTGTGGSTAFSSASDTASITVTPVNDQPVLTPTGDSHLTAINESVANPAGNTVASIIASGTSSTTDFDPLDPHGIAVTNVDNTNGTWQYSIDGGSNWINFSGLSASTATLLTSTDLVRFVPTANFFGFAGNITYKVWDQSDGFVAGATNVDTTEPAAFIGGEFAVSSVAGSYARAMALNDTQQVILWERTSGAGTGDIYMRVMNDDGSFATGEIRLVDSIDFSVMYSFTVLGNGNIAVVWAASSAGDTAFSSSLYYQVFQPNGSPVAAMPSPTLLLAGTFVPSFDNKLPDIAAIVGSPDQAIITWSGNQGNIFARRVDSAGGFVTGQFSVMSFADTGGPVLHNSVTPLLNGGYVVAVSSAESGGNPGEIFYRVFSSSNVGGSIVKVANSYNHPSVDVQVLANDDFILAYSTDTDLIRAVIYSPAGVQKSTFTIPGGPSDLRIIDDGGYNPASGGAVFPVTVDEGGGFFYAYNGNGNAYGILYSATGAPIVQPFAGAAEFVVTNGGGSPSVSSLGDGRYLYLYNGVSGRIVNLIAEGPAYSSSTDVAGITVNQTVTRTLSIGNASVSEGDSGNTALGFTVSLNVASSSTITVNYSTSNGTATTANNDYTGVSGTLTFAPGETSKTITVNVTGDLIFENNETFSVNLSSPTNATISTATAVGTIVNDDATPTVSIDDVTKVEGNGSAASVIFTVTRTGYTAFDTTFNYATADGTAFAADNDYYTISGSGYIASGGLTGTVIFAVSIVGDTKYEADETVLVNLSNVVGAAVADGQGVATIINDDAAPTLTINDVTVTEGNSGTTTMTFTVTRTGVTSLTTTFDYTTADGTALSSDSDYVAISGSGSIAAGGSSGTTTITVTVNGDLKNESNETLFVNLSNAVYGNITDSQGVGTINNDDPLPAISISSVSDSEGDSGDTVYTFTVSLNAPSGQTVTVDYTTTDGTATTADDDYTAAMGTLTFAPGETTKTISVNVKGDLQYEGDEQFTVNLTNPTNATISNGVGSADVYNDDVAPTLSVVDSSVLEGNSGTTIITLTVTRTGYTAFDATVDYSTINISATLADNDYVASSGTLTIAAGGATGSSTITLTINGDTKFETSEKFDVQFSNPVNAFMFDLFGSAVIQNDDLQPTISIDSVTHSEGDSGNTAYTFTVSLSNPSYQTITVNYTTVDGTALAGSDYTAVSGTLTFAPNETTKTITVNAIGDLVYENNEAFSVQLSAPTNATISTSTGAGTINNDDAAPALTINDVVVSEGNSGTTIITFTVTRTGLTDLDAAFDYATADLTALVSDSDYVTTSGSGLIAGGGATGTTTLTVTVNGDTKYEGNEDLLVNLTNPGNATIADSQGVGRITNDDLQPTISIDSVTHNEGNSGTTTYLFTVSLTNPSDQTITVNYATVDGTAIAGSDYTAASGTLTFAPGETAKTITVNGIGDLVYENNEAFSVLLSSPTNATIVAASGTGTLTNDDATPTLTIDDVTVTEGNTGTTIMTFTVTRTGLTDLASTFNYATADGIALTSDSDYVAASGSGSIAAGGATGTTTISVTINGDNKYEQNDTLFVNLTNAGNAVISDAQGQGTITNDDALPSISTNTGSVVEGNSGVGAQFFGFTLSNPSYQTITVDYSTSNGSATLADGDYNGASGTAVFTPGTTFVLIPVTVNGDTKFEAGETFRVSYTNPVNAQFFVSRFRDITITNDDSAPTLAINDVSVSEGDSGTTAFTFTVTRTGLTDFAATFNYSTANGTATLTNGDYSSASGAGSIAAGGATATTTITVFVNGDTTFENNETFLVNLTTPGNATIADGQGVGTITNDDAEPVISIDSVTHNEGNSGTTSYVFTVSLTNPSDQTITVNYATVDGTAIAGSDYTAATGTLTFAPGETTKTITVNATGDLVYENNEAFTVLLSTPVNATIATDTGVGTVNNDDTAPTLTINDVTVSEGGGGTTIMTFTVTRTGLTDLGTTFNYATSDGTATVVDGDYATTSGSGLIGAGGATGTTTITVTVNGDITFEGDETLLINLSNPGNATITDGQGIGTITNDDAAPTISIDSVTHSEGNSGTTAYLFTVSLTNPSDQTITVNYATVDGTAIAGSDYTAATGTLTFAPGETSKTITVNATGDLVYENNEAFTVLLSTPVNATIATDTGIGTVNNDDAAPTLTINDVTVTEGDGGTTIMTFTVTRTGLTDLGTTFNYATSDGTATVVDGDYATTSGSGLIGAGGATGTTTITVTINGDIKFEGNENLLVNLSNPGNVTITDGQGVGTITNDDPSPAISIDSVTHSEGDSGNTVYTFTVSLNNITDQTVTVNYTTVDGTALAGSDYTAVTGTLTFAPGETTKTITVNAIGDLVYENNEAFSIQLSTPVNGTIATGTGVGTVTNDDVAPVLTINDVTASEGDGGTTVITFTVTRTGLTSFATTFSYATSDGTATVVGGDYAGTSGSGSIAVGGGTGTTTITVVVNGDTTFEPNETFAVNLTDGGNGTIVDGQGVGTITNDDSQPTISINSISVEEGNGGSTDYVFVVSLSNGSYQSITVDYTTQDGTATASDNDYAPISGTLVFAPGEATKTIVVQGYGDVVQENHESFSVALSGSTNSAINIGVGVATIINDDVDVVTPPPPTEDMNGLSMRMMMTTLQPLHIMQEAPVEERFTSEPPLTAQDMEPMRFEASVIAPPPYRPSFTQSIVDIILTPFRWENSVANKDDLNIMTRLRLSAQGVLDEGTFNIFLTTKPTAPVMIELTTQNSGTETITPNVVIFTPENWNSPQQVAIKVTGEGKAHPRMIQVITQPAVSDDPDYSGYDPRDIFLNVGNNNVGSAEPQAIEGKDTSHEVKQVKAKSGERAKDGQK